jgi:predicted transcriptional regulator
MDSDKQIIAQLKEENATLQQNNQALTQTVSRLQKEIIGLNAMKRVKSEKYKLKVIKLLKAENKITTSETAELLKIAPGNASRVLRLMLDAGIIM